MKLRHFVSASAVVLTGWLAVTFMYHMPSQRYPKLDKYPATAVSPAPGTSGNPVQPEFFPVSASR